jgi:hypothetical protein
MVKGVLSYTVTAVDGAEHTLESALVCRCPRDDGTRFEGVVHVSDDDFDGDCRFLV